MGGYEITNEQCEQIEELLSQPHTGKGRPEKDNHTMLNGMMWIAGSGAQWRELPEKYGPWQTVYSKYRKWKRGGVLEKVFKALSEDADMKRI